MKTASQLDKRAIDLNHRVEMKRLQNKNDFELEKIKEKHSNLKDQIKLNQTLEKNALHTDHQIELSKKVHKNEKIFDKLQESLKQVKDQTRSEKSRIQDDHKGQLEFLKANFDDISKGKKEKNTYLLQDMDHQAQVHINKLQRRMNSKEQEVKSQGSEELSGIELKSNTKKEMTKHIYSKEQDAQALKFQSALMTQKKNNNKQLVFEDQKHQQMFSTKEKIHSNEKEIQESHYRKNQEKLQRSHEEKYSTIFKRNEFVLKNLLSRKEKIFQNLRQTLKQELRKEIALDKDPFYQYHNLAQKLELSPKKDSYIVSIKVPKHEAQNIKLTGYDREIKITMDRNFDFNKNHKSGARDSVKRAESYLTKLPVEYILDSKNISKKYEDGILKFKIGLA